MYTMWGGHVVEGDSHKHAFFVLCVGRIIPTEEVRYGHGDEIKCEDCKKLIETEMSQPERYPAVAVEVVQEKKQWEYKYVRNFDTVREEALEGWRLVSVAFNPLTTNAYFYLEREIIE